MSAPPPIEIVPVDGRGDLVAWIHVHNAVHRHDRSTAEEMEAFLAQLPWHVSLLARAGGEVVGNGAVSPRFDAPDSDIGHVELTVLPGHRRRGAGRALFAALSATGREHGLQSARTSVSAAEPDALAFLGRRGFREVGRDQLVALAVADARPAGRPPPEGVEIVTLADRPDLAESAYEVACEAYPDVPADPPMEVLPYDRWRGMNLEAPWSRPEAFFAAMSDGRVVGYAVLSFPGAMPEVADHQMTAVRRAWRGRGVASALKDAQLRFAQQAGIERLLTANELRNEPIRRLNARLGYAPLPEQVKLRGPLAA